MHARNTRLSIAKKNSFWVHLTKYYITATSRCSIKRVCLYNFSIWSNATTKSFVEKSHVWVNGRQSTGRQTNRATTNRATHIGQVGDNSPNFFMHFVHVLIFVNYRAGLTLSRIWWHRLRDHCISMKVQNVVMFVVMPLSKCQYLLTFHKTWTSAQSMPASSLASTKCATGSPETVSSGGILSVLSTNRTIWFGSHKRSWGNCRPVDRYVSPSWLSPGWLSPSFSIAQLTAHRVNMFRKNGFLYICYNS